MKRMDINEREQQAESGLRRVEALLRASADWEPDASAPVGLAADALRSRKKTGFAAWAASLFPARPALVGLGASAALAAGAAFLWMAANGGSSGQQRLNATVPDAAINAAITEVGEQINVPLVAQSNTLKADSEADRDDDAAVKPKATTVNLPVKKRETAPAGGAAKAQTGTPPRSKRKTGSGARKNHRQERRLGVPIPLPRRPKAILAHDTPSKSTRQKNRPKAPAALWKTETVQQYTYGAGTPVLVEQPSEDGSGTIMVPAIALNDSSEITPYDPTIDPE